MKRARFTEEQIIGVLREHEADAKAADLGRKHGVSEATLYNWKSSFEANKAYFEKLAGVKSPDKFLELTTEHTKSAFETFVAEATKIGDLYKNFAKEAFTPITAAKS